MRVIGVTEFNGPDALALVDVPEPSAGLGEIRIRVHAATVNPTDTYTSTGARAKALRASGPPPYVPGMDAAGVVDEIGEGVVTDLAIGDRVMAIVVPSGGHGAYSEQIVVPAASVARMPARTSFAEASTLPMNGLTARMALDRLHLRPGQILAVTGAAGAFGGYTVQLAKADGLQVIADASPADEQLVRSLGADFVVPRGDDVAAHIRRLVSTGVDGVADGAVLDHSIVPAVRDGGAIATVRYLKGEAERGVRFLPLSVSQYHREQEKLDRLRQQAEAGELTLRVARVFPPEEAPEAHRVLAAGGTRGRLVIQFP